MRNKKSDLDSVGVSFPSQHISAENKLGVAATQAPPCWMGWGTPLHRRLRM